MERRESTGCRRGWHNVTRGGMSSIWLHFYNVNAWRSRWFIITNRNNNKWFGINLFETGITMFVIVNTQYGWMNSCKEGCGVSSETCSTIQCCLTLDYPLVQYHQLWLQSRYCLSSNGMIVGGTMIPILHSFRRLVVLVQSMGLR